MHASGQGAVCRHPHPPGGAPITQKTVLAPWIDPAPYLTPPLIMMSSPTHRHLEGIVQANKPPGSAAQG